MIDRERANKQLKRNYRRITMCIPDEQVRHLLARDSSRTVQAIPSVYGLSMCATVEEPYSELRERETERDRETDRQTENITNKVNTGC